MRMKNKKAKQSADRRKHREQLKAERRAKPTLERPIARLIEKPTILIVCDGENTEPSYFNQFRVASATVKCVGKGYNTITTVKEAEQLAKRDKYDQVWCVFDKDDFSKDQFNGAIKLAQSLHLGIAYSNQSFEYWLILHFDDHQGGGMHRNNYNSKINNLLKPFNIKYDGKDRKLINEDFFELLDGVDAKTNKKRVDLAILRAEKIYNQYDHVSPANEESSTTVFRLVRELLKFR